MKKNIISFCILILIVFTTQAQQKINLVVNEKYRVVETLNDSLISNHNFEREATESLINYFNKTGSETGRIFYPSEMRIDFEGSKPIATSEVVMDTFTTIADYILLDYTNSLVEPTSQAIKYALITSIGLAEIESDTIYRFQKYFKLARERGFGYAKYKSIGLPFQFRDSVNLQPERTRIRIQTFATKSHCVSYYVDNKEEVINASCKPGKLSDIEWRHTHFFENLQPGTEYLLRVEGNVLETGEFDFVEWKVKTLD